MECSQHRIETSKHQRVVLYTPYHNKVAIDTARLSLPLKLASLFFGLKSTG